jgi:hypothetical protein
MSINITWRRIMKCFKISKKTLAEMRIETIYESERESKREKRDEI